MSKPIFLTDEYIDNMVAEFRKNVSESKMSNGKITYTKEFKYEGEDDTKAYINFTPDAYVKMIALLRHFDSEVAWHGIVERREDDTFIIKDIMVYPQTVTGSTVNTDQEEYQKWTLTMDDEVFNAMRMQGHSHVNMGTTPSGVDTNHQDQILAQLQGEDYYIFMIYNKRLEHTIKIYDYSNNVMYEDKDIVVGILGNDFDMESFLAEADGAVKKKVYANTYGAGHQSAYGQGTYGNGYGNYGSRVYKYEDDDDPPARVPAAKGAANASDISSGKKEEKSKGKRGRPPKSGKKDAASPGQMGITYYGGNNASGYTDYDKEIFGDHRIN